MENQAVIIKICEVINFLIIQLFEKLDNVKGGCVMRNTSPLFSSNSLRDTLLNP